MTVTFTREAALLNSGVKVRRLEIDLAHPDSAAQVLDVAQGWLGLPGPLHSGPVEQLDAATL